MLSSNCQNITNREARMVVERCGKDSKVILLGDLSQVENPYLDAQSNGLAHAVNGGMKSPLVASILLRKVERSELASVASEIFNRPERRR
jgi:PhoH-like ATPase